MFSEMDGAADILCEKKCSQMLLILFDVCALSML